MFYGMRKAFPGVKVISEEHEENPAVAEVPFPVETNNQVLENFKNSENDLVNAEDVAVWIDPLDATQEYTGKEI